MKQIAVALGGGLLLVALTADATQRIGISVSPRMGFEPTNLVVRVVTERHADNRLVKVVAESDGFAASSERQLDGEDGPRTATFEFRQLPAGVYDVRATLIGANGRTRAEADARATVIGADGTR
jgi:hypothetical protein